MLDVIILAAGKGTRMRSDKPKVLHTLAGKPFLQHVLDRAHGLNARNIYVVVGHGAEQVQAAMGSEQLSYVEQTEQKGTGHAVQQVLPHLAHEGVSLILYGDVPLIGQETLQALCSQVSSDSLGLLTVKLGNPFGYGRILRDSDGSVVGVVEQKDATESQLTITEVNTGVMAVNNADLHRWLPQLSDNNAQGEYLLPDIIALAHSEGKAIVTAQPAAEYEVLGVNNRSQQAELERIYQRNTADALMEQGLTLLDPARFDCRGTLRAGKDCSIDVGCVFEGEVVLGDNVSIGPHCHIKDALIGNGVEVKSHSVIEGAELGDNSVAGPFARLRPQAKLATGAKVGNFVEIKKANIGPGSKVNHLSYVGDAEVGADVNIGAGTITCNYDGVKKSLTTLEDGVFIGSNTALVAPVSIGRNATVGAGSVITQNVEQDGLAVARTKQRVVANWKNRKKDKS